jgi:DNA topoisomerase VI subunit B
MVARAAPKLERQAFTTSRLAEFCSEKELQIQTAQPKERWPLVILKELVDNALDAAEETDVAPIVTVSVKEGTIVIADNGPGMKAETIEDILDYSSRTSSREAYVSPTCGRGNLETALPGPARRAIHRARAMRTGRS